MHSALHSLNDKLGFEFTSVQKCSGEPASVQVEVTGDNNRVFYFKVAGNSVFQMKSVSTAPDSTCRGENILDTMATS